MNKSRRTFLQTGAVDPTCGFYVEKLNYYRRAAVLEDTLAQTHNF